LNEWRRQEEWEEEDTEMKRERGKKSNVILISGQIIYPLVPQLC
jgi:hypothetical protein